MASRVCSTCGATIDPTGPGRSAGPASGPLCHDCQARAQLAGPALPAPVSDRPELSAPDPWRGLTGDDRFHARYDVHGLLGEGSFGVIVRATQRATGREVAIKILSALKEPSARERFLREGRLLAKVHHPGVVEILDLGVAGATPYLVLELFDRGSLEALLAARAPLPLDEAAALMVGIAEALAHCHGLGVVHRDLKPGNVLIASDGSPRLADFGLALWMLESHRLTETGAVLGTPRYMAPEMLGGEVAGPAADVYAAGLIYYQMLTGTSPFDTSTPQRSIMSHLYAEPEPLLSRRSGVPPALAQVVHRCLEKEPGSRFPDGAALTGRLATALERERSVAPPPVRPAPTPGPSPGALDPGDAPGRRRRTLPGPMAVAVAAVALLVSIFLARPGPLTVGVAPPARRSGPGLHVRPRLTLVAPGTGAGHAGAVLALAFSPDGGHLASGGADGQVRGGHLASGGADGQVRLWDLSGPGRRDRVASSAAEPGGIVRDGGPFASLIPPPKPPPGSPPGLDRVASSAAEPGGIVRDGGPFASLIPPPKPPSGSPSRLVRAHAAGGAVEHLAFSPNFRWLSIRRADGAVQLLDGTRAGAVTRIATGSVTALAFVRWRPAAGRSTEALATIGADRRLTLHDPATGRISLRGPPLTLSSGLAVTGLAGAPEGREPRLFVLLTSLRAADDPIAELGIVAGELFVYTSLRRWTDSARPRVLDPALQLAIRRYRVDALGATTLIDVADLAVGPHGPSLGEPPVSPDVLLAAPAGRLLVAGGRGGTVAIRSLDRSEVSRHRSASLLAWASWVAHRASVTALAAGLDGRTLASGAADGTLRVWTAHREQQGR
ncbi:MAG: protein kinase [Candidatus Riflebacteria bacterium]|nr:protein kinase [Candidatus Riflebacteria bacterium]